MNEAISRTYPLRRVLVDARLGPVPGEKRRSPWAGMLGLFAAIPITYLALVIVYQVLQNSIRQLCMARTAQQPGNRAPTLQGIVFVQIQQV